MGKGSHGRVAVITGATGGIGSAVARELSSMGYSLVLSGRSAAKLDALASSLNGPCTTLAADICDAAVPEALLAQAIQSFHRCDLCFNNAGMLETGPIEKIDIDRVCEMVRVNVEGAVRIAYVFVRHFLGQASGHLINTSSVLGKKIRPTAGAYAATKYAIEALSEALRVELARTDVQVTCIQPGLVKTGLHHRWEVPPGQLMGIAEPLIPADIARMVRFILEQPANVRIPQLMMLPKGHEI